MSHTGTRVLALALIIASVCQAASATQEEVVAISGDGTGIQSAQPPQPVGAEQFIFSDQSVLDGLPPGYTRPASQWREREKQRYQDLLARGTYDLMVVPFQVHGYALDRPSRSLMTAELTYALAEATGKRLPDPYLLSRALGEGQRQYDSLEVTQVARKLGIEEIVWAHVGHTRELRMNLMVQQLKLWNFPAPSFAEGPGKKSFSGIPFSESESPIEVFHHGSFGGRALGEIDGRQTRDLVLRGSSELARAD